ncbi:MAG: SDR family oxidoreductase [Acidimicrobiales bacterium]|nr:SDR family oxidoreductase [Hyphomonadaceae bacterium]RZV38753.1 MAG: SDR family oxidoreductase [Acidimicrobiales bacterium]
MAKSILITGAGARVGRVLAEGLAKDEWAVAIHYNRSQLAADAMVQEIRDQGGKAVAVQANLNVPAELESLVDRSASALDLPLTALINNASTFAPDEADAFSNAQYDHHMDVNLRAPLRLSQHFAAQLQTDGEGVIINMLDQRVLDPSPDYFTYSISKSALFAATKTMAQAFAPRIRVCGVGPGPTLQNVHQTGDNFNEEVSRTLLGKGSPPETILHAVQYLLSARAVTGQMIAVDGGEHLIF